MDIKDYTGKVVRVSYKYKGENVSDVGIVIKQDTSANRVKFSMMLTNGTTWGPSYETNSKYVTDFKVTSARIDESLRGALVDYYKAKTKQEAFLDRFWKEKREHELNVEGAIAKVKEYSGDMSVSHCMKVIEDVFRERYPSSGGNWSQKYFECRSGCKDSVTVSQCQEITKWATPEEYSFIHRRYDQTLCIDNDSEECKRFCVRNAPAVLPELSKFKTEVYATIGDKGFLSVERSYDIPLKYGPSKKSIDYIKDCVFGMKRSLADVMTDASKQSSKTADKSKVRDEVQR